MFRKEESFAEMATTLGHLPIFRRHLQFEIAGIVGTAVLWMSQLAGFVLWILVTCQLLFGASTMFHLALSVGLLQGVLGVLGPMLWYVLLPGVGIGRTYNLWILWAFQATVITAGIHLLVCCGAVVWAYKIHSGQHHFEKLPSEEPDPAGEMEMETIDMELGEGSGGLEEEEEEDMFIENEGGDEDTADQL